MNLNFLIVFFVATFSTWSEAAAVTTDLPKCPDFSAKVRNICVDKTDGICKDKIKVYAENTLDKVRERAYAGFFTFMSRDSSLSMWTDDFDGLREKAVKQAEDNNIKKEENMKQIDKLAGINDCVLIV
jgi:hypothetical protein